MWINRTFEEKVRTVQSTRPALLLSGARQTGKSSLLRRMFPDADYITLDRILVAENAEHNPESFLRQFNSEVILDEIQYAPSLFRELKILIDENRQRYGKWILTGSQKLNLMKNVSESLAGRIGILQLHTLNAEELRMHGFSSEILKSTIWAGGYPEIWANPSINREMFFTDYIQTYLEKDLKALINVSDLRTFQRFIIVCAGRAGQILNYSGLANDLGISAVTAKSWINALEASGIISLLPPYYANIGKRLIKSPMLYFCDTGLLAHLLNINNEESFEQSIYKGAIWENFTFCELIKTCDAIPGRNLFFYRDQNGVEIDFVVEKNETLYLIEAKAAERVDSRKLNFRKVSNLFRNRTTECILSCNINEKKQLNLTGYTACNPLFCKLLPHSNS